MDDDVAIYFHLMPVSTFTMVKTFPDLCGKCGELFPLAVSRPPLASPAVTDSLLMSHNGFL